MNQRTSKANKLGEKGVCFVPKSGKYKAKIVANGVAYHLGYHEKIDDAREAYKNASLDLHGSFGRIK